MNSINNDIMYDRIVLSTVRSIMMTSFMAGFNLFMAYHYLMISNHLGFSLCSTAAMVSIWTSYNLYKIFKV